MGSITESRRWAHAFDALDDIRRLGHNWDSYDADPIPQAVCDRVEMLLDLLHDSGWNPPYVVPSAQGTIQLEWHENGIDEEWEIYVEPWSATRDAGS